ncbi:MAG: hypothetical protein LBV16_09375 [Elusimicrobiota bacterium]|nr:hypothetical protein [Elusimicrobiota bacterium]
MDIEQIKIKEIKGNPKGVRALNVYCKLVIGLAMTYFNTEKTFEDFLKAFEEYDVEKRRKLLKFACLLVQLDADEVEALTRFAIDSADNIAYENPMLANLKPSEIVSIMTEVVFRVILREIAESI